MEQVKMEDHKGVSAKRWTASSNVQVWICGHCIVHWAHVRASNCGMGNNLGLPAGVCISWISRCGMRWEELMPVVKAKAGSFGPPDILIIQLGENDLAFRKSLDFLLNIKKDFDELAALFPMIALFWSSLLKRRVWHGSHSPVAIDKSRKLLNCVVARKLPFMNGHVIEHPDNRFSEVALFHDNGVHLSDQGNDVWLADITQSIRDWLQL
ncbi:uncharacterized protein LOC132592634 [Zootoca vivipara]|uniref:uncharacterized protein LOC132592634 n=1 Tax=Zootoca vivipara TaxID=8524 RepID=UPI00293BC467|nr:uncharacterized protein LOC132592634 [Zootoca vivipara]